MSCFALCVPQVRLRKPWIETPCRESHSRVVSFVCTGAPHFSYTSGFQKCVETLSNYMATTSLMNGEYIG